MIAAATLIGTGPSAWSQPSSYSNSPHLDPDHGVLRIDDPAAPRGSCSQCHFMKGPVTGGPPWPGLLFEENSNQLCYSAGGACHQLRPVNYPADEDSRIPAGFPDAGYFEYNTGGSRVHGVEYRNRWPGEAVYENTARATVGSGYFSPHRNDPDMPRVDPLGSGSCLSCHDAHGSDNPFDMLLGSYRGIGGSTQATPPTQYGLCFKCHSNFGPPAMEITGRLIADFYDSTLNPDTRAGHQIRLNPAVAISWPPHLRAGDKLPCYDCHNPHGSQGYDAAGPNAFLISDERPGWANLTDTKTDPMQSRAFCLGCHIPSDGVPGSQRVEGIVMNAISDRDGHRSGDFQGCFECHGADYTTSNSNNVHHPGPGG
ncbi:MAG TPA: cytochrome c3 family protein [Gemmatimonadaceae bacterium]